MKRRPGELITHDVVHNGSKTVCGRKVTAATNVSNRPTCQQCRASKLPDSKRAR